MSTSNFLPLHMPHCDDSKMSLLPDENSMPEDFAGKPDAAISPFYKALSRTLGGPTSSPGAKAIKVKDMIKGRFARTKMGQISTPSSDIEGSCLTLTARVLGTG